MTTKMKQKIVLEVLMPCPKCKMGARKIAALTEGMTKMAIDEAKNQLVIEGVGVDVPVLATELRKKVGRTNIISVQEVKSEEEAAAKKKKEVEEAKKRKEEAARNGTVTWSYYDQYNNYPRPLPPPGYDVVCYGAPNYSYSLW